jgi:hypothetical protein
VNLKKADEEAAKGVAVRDIIADHRATVENLRILWYAMLLLWAASVVFEWAPGRTGGCIGLVVTSIVEIVYRRKKFK